MRALLQHLNRLAFRFGFDARRFWSAFTFKSPDWYAADLREFMRQRANDETFPKVNRMPRLSDKYAEGGIMRGAYFHQDLYVARKIFQAAPRKHVDIGSRTDGFVAHVAAFRPIEVLDIRPITSNVKNIAFKQADLMTLQPDMVSYCDSISSLHALEHFGLGRYGDPVDYWGYQKAISAITQILEPGGSFYFSVPIGPQRIEFNAHRVFAVSYLIELLRAFYETVDFSYVDDIGDIHENVELDADLIATNCGCNYGCGIFTLRRKMTTGTTQRPD
jgi:SAM-dependent methyltransferase